MLERITTALFRPKGLFKYLPDRMYKVILIFLFVLAVAMTPTLCLLKNGTPITALEYSYIEESIKESEGGLVIKNGNIILSDLIITTNLYHYGFNSDAYKNDYFNIIFEDSNNVSIYAYGIKLKSKEVSIKDMEINKLSSSEEIMVLSSLLYNIVYESKDVIIACYVVINCIFLLIESLVYIGLLYFVGYLINKMVKGRFKLILCIYSLIPYLLFEAFAGFLGYEILSYIGVIISYFAYQKSISIITRIEYKRE